jgi:hypothetical protein
VKAAEQVKAWKTGCNEFADAPANQLLRSHLLVSMVARERGIAQLPQMVLVSLAGDRTSTAVADTYGRCLVDTSNFEHSSLERFVGAMAATASTTDQLRTANDLTTRYVDFSRSEHLDATG